RLARGEALTVWTTELRMVLLICGLGLLFLPLAASPADSWKTLVDVYLKIVCIFFLLTNLLDTTARLRSILKLVVCWGAVLALDAVYSFASGQFTNREHRIEGMVQGIFGNPNDLAVSLNLLLPLAVALAMSNRGWKRVFYMVCAVAMGMGVVATFSRGGFLGLLAAGSVLLWKLGRSRRAAAALTLTLVCGAFLMFMPSEYSGRLSTILSSDTDKTGSSQERRELLKRAAGVALSHPIIGVGIGNYHIYSLKEKLAHNAYLEITAELGVTGLLAYLALILTPLSSMRRVGRETSAALRAATDTATRAQLHELNSLSIALQAAFAAYIVCSLFGSIQYQWFLYYIAAYAVAVRRIHATENTEQRTTKTEETPPPQKQVRPVTRLGRMNSPPWPESATNG
ncbi:MAG TPA: O-antigen ligase family protein, partial [Blastocatellia bacterium]|nr:O-antigen ligase family protein [Blastocatellia bacterium]